jgi:poly-gamma-glutamate synthesis protein (capsule biosynthesis protein)
MRPKYFLLFIFFATLVYWILNPYYDIHEIDASADTIILDSTISVNFSVVGDIMCHSTQYYYAWVEKDSFDFDPMFGVIGDYLKGRDIVIGNLETVLAGESKNYSGYPFFNSPNSLANSLKNAGFDFVTTANNHANDMGYNGVIRTIDALDKLGIIHLGTDSLETKVKNNVYVHKGIKMGILAYTYGTNFREGSKNPRKYVEYIDTVKIKDDIEGLKAANADIIILLYHFGEQYQKSISNYQEKIVERSIEYGADIILGSHPHIIQHFDSFPTMEGNLDTGFVVYSLGNFVSNQRWRFSDGGIIFNFELTKNLFSDSIYVSDISYLPIWVFKGKKDNRKEYIILPSEKYNDTTEYYYLTEADVDSMKRSFQDNIKQLTKKSNQPKLVNWE